MELFRIVLPWEQGRSATEPTPLPSLHRRKLIPLVLAIALIAAVLLGYQLWRIKTPSSMGGRAPATSNSEDLTGPRSSIVEKSIAVLPFENLSSDKENAYFADGIQDEILTRLSKIADLKVISRSSTQKYKSAPDDIRNIGKQLGVAHLLEGSVQKVAGAVHVNVQLIKAATDEHLWAESYDRKLDDVFAVEGEVATAIAEQLNAKLSGAEHKAVTDRPTQNPAAYDAYLRAISIDTTRNDDAAVFDEANALATATRLDPNFALAWAQLTVVRSRLYFNGTDLANNSAVAVKEAADKAMALQPELGEAFLAQGVYRYRVLRDFTGALESYGEALKRLPNSGDVLEQMAHVERRLARWDAAEKHYRRALELDPRNMDYLSSLADCLGALRHFDEAQSTWNRALELSPGDEVIIGNKALLYQMQGRLDESARQLGRIDNKSPNFVVALAKSLQLTYERRFDDAIAAIQQSGSKDFKSDPRAITSIGWLQIWAGHKEEARASFERAISSIKPTAGSIVPVDSRNLPSFLAWAYAGLGEKEKALEQAKRGVTDFESDSLQKAFAEQAQAWIHSYFGDFDSAIAALPHLLEVPGGVTPGLLRIDPVWDPLRKDVRFEKLCQERR